MAPYESIHIEVKKINETLAINLNYSRKVNMDNLDGSGNSGHGEKRKREYDEAKSFHNNRESPPSARQFLRQLDTAGLLSGTGEFAHRSLQHSFSGTPAKPLPKSTPNANF